MGIVKLLKAIRTNQSIRRSEVGKEMARGWKN